MECTVVKGPEEPKTLQEIPGAYTSSTLSEEMFAFLEEVSGHIRGYLKLNYPLHFY